MNEPDDNDINRRLAITALSMDTESHATGSRPDHDELWDFIHGAVSDSRRQEILSHLADDADLFDQWHSMKSVISELADQPDESAVVHPLPDASETSDGTEDGYRPPTVSRWRRLLTFPTQQLWLTAGFAVAVAGILILVSSDPPPAEPQDFWADMSQPISSASGRSDAALQADLDALKAGMREQLDELDYLPVSPSGQPLPDRVPDCENSDNSCKARRQALYQLGSLAVEQLHHCNRQSPQKIPELPSPGIAAITVIDQEMPELLIAPLSQWLLAYGQDSHNVCEAAANVIGRAVTDG